MEYRRVNQEAQANRRAEAQAKAKKRTEARAQAKAPAHRLAWLSGGLRIEDFTRVLTDQQPNGLSSYKIRHTPSGMEGKEIRRYPRESPPWDCKYVEDRLVLEGDVAVVVEAQQMDMQAWVTRDVCERSALIDFTAQREGEDDEDAEAEAKAKALEVLAVYPSHRTLPLSCRIFSHFRGCAEPRFAARV